MIYGHVVENLCWIEISDRYSRRSQIHANRFNVIENLNISGFDDFLFGVLLECDREAGLSSKQV